MTTVATTPNWDEPVAGLALSVVVPYFRYDVRPLAERLLAQARPFGGAVEIILLDDGSPETAWHDALAPLLQQSGARLCSGRLDANVGRAAIRNHLLGLARAPYLLYLDSDMWPDHDDFLAKYVGWARAGVVDVVYGGRSVDTVTRTGEEYRLHRDMTAVREALPAQVRRQAPEMSFYSCNFLVRRTVLEAFPLDERFTGWGWEDCEWAARVSRRFGISHEDNPASHLGLLTVDDIMSKYRQSLGNFKLMLSLHPQLVATTSLYRVARLLKKLHAGSATARLAAALSAARGLPTALRLRTLALYKAALYARVV